MGNTTSSLNLFATCLPQHPASTEQQQKSSFNPTPVEEDQAKSDDFSDHFDEEKKATKNESKEISDGKTNGHQLPTNHVQTTEKVANAMRLEKKDKETSSLKLSKEKEPTNPSSDLSDKILGESTSQNSSPKTSPLEVKPPKPVSQVQSKQTVQDSSNTTTNTTTQSQDVDFFSDMTPQYVAPKKIQIQPKPQPTQPMVQQTKIKIDLEAANKPENLDAVGWDEEEIQIEASADLDVNNDDSNPTQPKRDRKKKAQTKETKQKPARLTAVKVKSNQTFDDNFEEESDPNHTNT